MSTLIWSGFVLERYNTIIVGAPHCVRHVEQVFILQGSKYLYTAYILSTMYRRCNLNLRLATTQMGCLSYSLEGSTVVQKVFNGKAAMPLLNKPTLPFSRTKILLCIIVHMKACVSTSDAELLDGCFFGIMSFVGQTLSWTKVGLTAGTASVSSTTSGSHSSTSLTILGLALIII